METGRGKDGREGETDRRDRELAGVRERRKTETYR